MIEHPEEYNPEVGTYDPNGVDQHSPGAKVDGGKIQPELIFRGFSRALREVAEVGTYGANKYTRDGWEQVPEAIRRYSDAFHRHQLQRYAGEECDAESKLRHLAHEAWNILAVLELTLREEENANR
jgi:hypothetical protein